MGALYALCHVCVLSEPATCFYFINRWWPLPRYACTGCAPGPTIPRPQSTAVHLARSHSCNNSLRGISAVVLPICQTGRSKLAGRHQRRWFWCWSGWCVSSSKLAREVALQRDRDRAPQVCDISPDSLFPHADSCVPGRVERQGPKGCQPRPGILPCQNLSLSFTWHSAVLQIPGLYAISYMINWLHLMLYKYQICIRNLV